MSNLLVQQLAKKFANTGTYDTNQKFRNQRHRLGQFADDLQLKLGMLVREMEHDIGLLRERGFTKKLYKMYVRLWNDLTSIYRKLDLEKPYSTVEEFLSYVKNKHVRDVIDNLDFLADHLEKTNVDFRPSPTLEQPQLRSLKLLKSLTQHLETYIKSNPLLPVPQMTSPEEEVDVPLLNVKPEPTIPSPNQEDKTAPGVPRAKKEMPNFNPFEKI